MDLHTLVDDLIVDTKGGVFSSSSIGLFLPELVLCGTIVLLLLVRLFDSRQRISLFWVSLVATGVALWLACPCDLASGGIKRVEIFTGLLVYDGFTVMIRSLLVGFAFLFLIFSRLSGIPDREDSADIYALVLGATVGLCLMVSANHMLMIFMAVEMASVPSYVLAGMLKGRRTGSEAALKYAIYGAGAAGVMLYGISLLVGLVGSAHLPTMAVLLAEKLPEFGNGELMVLSLGGLMLGVGLAFKLSAVPFHFWCPDVFHGACAEVNAFLSVASKAAALALLVRVAIGLGTVPPDSLQAGTNLQVQAIHQQQPDDLATLSTTTQFTSKALPAIERRSTSSRDESIAALSPVRTFIGRLIALIAIITCTFGNLAAYGQTNIKRLLAYSTIAHAGYMMMALAPVMVLAGMDAAGAEQAVAGLIIYIVVYLFMNLGAFAVVAFLRNTLGSEEISSYRGLIRTSPGIAVCFSLMMFSLVGLPPLAGFLGKFAIFASLAEGFSTAGQNYLMVLLVVGGINTAISLFYYLRVVKVMVMEDAPDPLPASLPLTRSPGGFFVFLLTIPTALLMINWEMLSTYATSAARYLIQNVS